MPKNIFKSKLFGGYDPADVAGYIEKINAQAAIEIEDAEKVSTKLKEDKEKLNNRGHKVLCDFGAVDAVVSDYDFSALAAIYPETQLIQVTV